MVKPNHLTVQCGSCSELVRPDTPAYRMHFIVFLMAAFGGIGGAAGLVVGIASAGVGFAAWPLFLLIGLYAGYKTGGAVAEYLDGYSCPECESAFSAPSVVSRARQIVPV